MKHVKGMTGAWRGTPKRSKRPYPAFCGQCHEPIDLETLVGKIRAGKRYVHPCGKVLARGDAVLRTGNEGEAPPIPVPPSTT